MTQPQTDIPVRAPAKTSADDTVQPFDVSALDLRGRVVRLGPAVDGILAPHNYPPPVAKLLGEAVALDDWREVVARAVADAKTGDQGARNWLAKYLLGSTPRTLLEIAADERRGLTPDDNIRFGASKARDDEGSDLDEDWDDCAGWP